LFVLVIVCFGLWNTGQLRQRICKDLENISRGEQYGFIPAFA